MTSTRPPASDVTFTGPWEDYQCPEDGRRWARLPEPFSAYEVSDSGIVRSMMRINVYADNSTSFHHGGRLSPAKDRGGYLFVCLASRNRRKKVLRIHRLVAAAFVPGGDPDERWMVNHMDGDKKNASWLNLEWVTPLENTQHSIHVLGHKVGGERHNAKLRPDLISWARGERARGRTYLSIATDVGVSRTVLSRAVRGKTWVHLAPKEHDEQQDGKNHP